MSEEIRIPLEISLATGSAEIPDLAPPVSTKLVFEWNCDWGQFLIGASWQRVFSVHRSFCVNLGPLFFAWYRVYE